MVSSICIRKNEKWLISTSLGNCHKYRHPRVNYCPTTYYHIWKQRQNPKADKLKTTSIQRETHTLYVIIQTHTNIQLCDSKNVTYKVSDSKMSLLHILPIKIRFPNQYNVTCFELYSYERHYTNTP